MKFSTVIVLALLLSACDSFDKAAREMPPLAVRVTQANVQYVILSMEMVGTTTGTQDVPIRTRVEGYMETMEFEEGTFVKKGVTRMAQASLSTGSRSHLLPARFCGF